jgi:hypothetical protein
LRFALLILKRAVKENDSRRFNAPAHRGMRNVFVEHDTVKHARVFNLISWYLLNAGIAFYVYFVRARWGGFRCWAVWRSAVVEI